jgi:acetyl/propionyl-CoA carboxylase alpha subunit
VRWDAGIVQGTEVGLHYDPLLAKLIVHAESRDAAISRMARALDELLIEGVATIAPFHRRVMDEPDFRAGTFHTGYLEQHPDLALVDGSDEERLKAMAVVAALLEDQRRRTLQVEDARDARAHASPWRWPGGGWSGRGGSC